MDNQKDNNISRGPQPETSGVHAMSNRTIDPISFFEKDEAFVFVYKKTEKLMTALYMVTNLFSDSEPMKWTIRKKVSDLLSFALGYKDTPASGHLGFTHEVKSKVLEIVSLLEVSSRSGLVSPMNFSILKQEFINLISVLEASELTQRESSQGSLPESFFDVARQNPRQTPMSPAYPREEATPRTPAPFATPIKDTQFPTENVFKKNNRQTIIIQLLKKKKSLTVKDIAQVIKDCSEKTIQRELIFLIEAGVITKTGERRWTQYSLVPSSTI